MTIIAWDGYDLAADTAMWRDDVIVEHTQKIVQYQHGHHTVWAAGMGDWTVIEAWRRQIKRRVRKAVEHDIFDEKFETPEGNASIFAVTQFHQNFFAFTLHKNGYATECDPDATFCNLTDWGAALMNVAGFTAGQTVQAAFGRQGCVGGSMNVINIRERPQAKAITWPSGMTFMPPETLLS